MSRIKTVNSPSLIVFSVGVFATCLIYFTWFHPIVLFDTDDWLYISYERLPIPLPGDWNPTRVFPEVFMSAMCLFSSEVVSRITGDWYSALTCTNAVVASCFIMTYVLLFERLVEAKSTLRRPSCICLAIVFFTLHFIVGFDGRNMFWSLNMTCFYYYTVSNLLCASIALWMIRMGTLDSALHSCGIVKTILVLLLLYFALLSNLFASIIMASWVISSMLVGLLEMRRLGESGLVPFVKKRWKSVVFVICWGLVQLLEVTGARAASIGSKAPGFLTSLVETLEKAQAVLLWMIAAMVLIVLLLMIYKRKNKRTADKPTLFMELKVPFTASIACLIAGVYLLLLSAKTFPWYINRPDVYFGFVFYALVIIFAMTWKVLGLIECPKLVMRGATIILVLFAIFTWPFSKASTIGSVPSSIAEGVSRDIVNQVAQATQQGLEEVTIEVPSFPSSDNWPISNYAAQRFPHALYSLGVIDYEPIAFMAISAEKNIELGLEGIAVDPEI